MTNSYDWTPDRMARAALTYVCEAANPLLGPLVAEHGAATILDDLRNRDDDSAWCRRAQAIDVPALVEQAEVLGLRFVIPDDPEWPAQLGDLGVIEPVQQMAGPPHGLWLKGPGDLARWSAASVALVGSRAASRYGEVVTTELAVDLVGARGSGKSAEDGWVVVSGGAYGIDAAAHRGAMAGEGRTIAVLAGGLDECYPRGNSRLFEELGSHQLLVSEVPPGIRPTRAGFLARNRLIAALTAGTIVVEAAARSGARNTANWAGQLGRLVMAVPGSVHSSMSVSCHRMIRDGQATLVSGADDVLALLQPIGQGPLLELGGVARPLDGLPVEQLRVREALPARGGRSAAELSLSSGVSLPDCLSALVELESQELVARVGETGWRLAWPGGRDG